MNPLALLRDFPIKTAVGVYESDGQCHRVRVGLSMLGPTRMKWVEEATDSKGAPTPAKLAQALSTVSSSLAATVQRFRKLAGKKLARASRGEAAKEAKKPTKKTAVIALPPESVTFISEPTALQGAASTPVLQPDRGSDSGDRAANTVVEDTIALKVGKHSFAATTRARSDEIEAVAASTDYRIDEGHRFEPSQWSTWRASLYFAPLKPKRGVHIRYIVGGSSALAVLAASDRALAWHNAAWGGEGEMAEALIQAFHLLNLHATRSLGLGTISQISVQGLPASQLEEVRASLWRVVGLELREAPGPAHDADFVAFGAALGAIDTRGESLNLARSLQPAPTLLSMMPWAEVGFVCFLFAAMFFVLQYYISDVSQQLATLKHRDQTATWAKGLSASKLKAETAALKKEVVPLRKFLNRELKFSRTFRSLGETLPPTTWLMSVTAEDLVWEKSPNKALGERYIMVSVGAPSETEGMAPPEINQALHALSKDAYVRRVLPLVKLTDVNWKREGGRGFAVFSALAQPRVK